VLNRLGFGPAPGDVDRVLAVGIPAYIEQQLHPERLDDARAALEVEALPTTRMADAEIVMGFERPIQNARKVAEKLRGPASEMDVGAAEQAKEMSRVMDELVPAVERPQRILDELTRARVLRAVYSQAQLNEVLVDFWMNHFNVFAGKDLDRAFLPTFERDVIRPNIWGCFRDLLAATAHSPAMLYYLDNSQSVAILENRTGAPSLPPIPFKSQPKPGLNENYARELLELHTLGVDGGYTQYDVTELARVLTGWTFAPPEEGGGFLFRAAVHDVCPKTVLGRRIGEGRGTDEGDEVLDLLARHPATARFISYKLCQRLVADDPPRALVDRVARVFLSTGGNLREVVRAIVGSPEFFDPAFYRAKTKTPFEYVVSAIRAVGAETDGGPAVSRRIAEEGEPLYLCAPPTGYKDRSGDWIGTGSLLARLNLATTLAADGLPGTRADLTAILTPAARKDPRQALAELRQALFAGDLSPDRERSIEECLLERAPENGPAGERRVREVLGLLLGSPEFQLH
jgi:uncharacterized protein (DUF1800 family)